MSDIETANENRALVEVRNLEVAFSVRRGVTTSTIRAVRGVSFSLARGSVLGIVGESGSGKSVTTSAIPGLLPPYAEVRGSVSFGGRELVGLGPKDLREYRGKRIGMIFQEPGRSYDPLQNMGSVFLETLRNSEPGLSRDEARERTVALLEEVGLSASRERLGNYPHQFSGGQLQRVGIALALAQGCELLIADEPTTALDVTIQAQIVSLLKKIRAERDLSMLFISHNIDLVAEVSDDIMVMYGGLVMETGPVSAILEAPLHPYTKALLAAAPRFGGHWSDGRLASIPGKVPDPGEVVTGCPFAPRCPLADPACLASVPPVVGGPGSGATGAAGARAVRCFRVTEVRQ